MSLTEQMLQSLDHLIHDREKKISEALEHKTYLDNPVIDQIEKELRFLHPMRHLSDKGELRKIYEEAIYSNLFEEEDDFFPSRLREYFAHELPQDAVLVARERRDYMLLRYAANVLDNDVLRREADRYEASSHTIIPLDSSGSFTDGPSNSAYDS